MLRPKFVPGSKRSSRSASGREAAGGRTPRSAAERRGLAPHASAEALSRAFGGFGGRLRRTASIGRESSARRRFEHVQPERRRKLGRDALSSIGETRVRYSG